MFVFKDIYDISVLESLEREMEKRDDLEYRLLDKKNLDPRVFQV
jgi:hypothetical protein